MPYAKPKPSSIASEAKKKYIPWINQQSLPGSVFYPHSSEIYVPFDPKRKLLFAVIQGNPVDVALDWHEVNQKDSTASDATRPEKEIAVVNMANEKRPGGDWEGGLIAFEEDLCRRSTLPSALRMLTLEAKYPIPETGGIYSPQVVVFRSGADQNHKVWKDYKSLPIISVAPIRRPKLNESGTAYAFDQEKELMKEKMRVVLRIAAHQQHKEICMGPFGVGPGMLNPAPLVAAMWREILVEELEFQGAFASVVFAIESSLDDHLKTGVGTVYEVFEKEFSSSNIVKSIYR